jgi:hypothetical protein
MKIEFPQFKKKSFSGFQYSARTIASTEKNDTPTESP